MRSEINLALILFLKIILFGMCLIALQAFGIGKPESLITALLIALFPKFGINIMKLGFTTLSKVSLILGDVVVNVLQGLGSLISALVAKNGKA